MTPAELYTTISDTAPQLFQCQPAPREGVLVQTPFLYPDGGVVEVCVIERNGRFAVTDHGEALGWLGMQSVRGNLSDNQRRLVDDVCQTLGVELKRGRLVLWRDDTSELGEALHRVGQAVVRVSDVWFTLRQRAGATVKDEVAEWLAGAEIPFDSDVLKAGRSGREWRIDYQTGADAGAALVSVLATGSRGAAPRIIERTLAGWVDLHYLKADAPGLAFVSLFDDTADVWREADFMLVNEWSEIAFASRPDAFVQMLTAA